MASSSNLRGSFGFLWDIAKNLGQGATSSVYRGRNKGTGEEVAVKVFNHAGNLRPLDVQMREYRVMEKLRHRNIVTLLAIEEEQGTHSKVIVMELTDHGSLFNMLEQSQHAYGLPEEEFLIVLDHVTCGMKHLRDNGIVHRDIKPGNILIFKGEDGRSIYKLTDFGAARELDEEEPFMSLYGTEEYLHPDMYERAVLRRPVRKQYKSTVDLWSLGVTFYHVCTGQLPFKPYGGRKNRDQMFQITRGKDSGVISGIQSSEGGKIEWSRELPHTCKLSLGLKRLVTPLLAGLLETDPQKVWTFDHFFREVENITQKVVVNVFCPLTWSNLRIYANKQDNYTTFQEMIADQTEIASSDQLLIFDGQLFKDTVQPKLPVNNYPPGITEKNPVFCFSIEGADFVRLSPTQIRDFPKFTSSQPPDDYVVAKMCSGIACFIRREVQIYSLNQDLVRRAVHLYVHELYHECGHLQDYYTHLETACRNSLKRQESLVRMLQRESVMLQLLCTQIDQRHLMWLDDLRQFTAEASIELDAVAVELKNSNDTVSAELTILKDEHIQKKSLLKQWNDTIGCTDEDRCVAKVDMHLDTVLKTKAQFQEDRRKPHLTFNEQQIHKFDKNKLSELCIKIKSLFTDHCESQARQQFQQFSSWYRVAQECRADSKSIEKKLMRLSEIVETFVNKMNELCLKYDSLVTDCIRRLEEKLSFTKEFQSLHQLAGKEQEQTVKEHSSGFSEKTAKRRHLLMSLVTQLKTTQEEVHFLKRDVETNSNLMRQFQDILQIGTGDTNTSSHQHF